MEDTDSDTDTFVIIGTSLAPYEEGEALKKPLSLQDQQVKDSKGRAARFHGAFTGGFSAGFFNTVGSKEGFTPSAFVSSRAKNNESSQSSQLPEDFMDDEDFEEHGIAPKRVSATTDFSSAKRKREKPRDWELLEELVVPSRTAMGITLLRQLGWKEGQGIGPRQRRKQKRKKNKATGQKVYGCALPGDSDDSENEDSIIPENVTFAPKDVNPIKFNPKDDVHGLGYSGINPRSALGSGSHISQFDESMPRAGYRTAGKIGMKGQAFGVGIEEDDEDEDIYGSISMDKYDRVLGGPTSDKNHGWTAPKHHGLSAAPVGYIGKVLEGFKLSTSTLKPKKNFPPPQLPRGFTPFHKKETEEKEEGITIGRKHMDANVRKNMLGEIKSVFDLVPAADKTKMEAAKVKSTTEGAKSNTTSHQSRFDEKVPSVAEAHNRFDDEVSSVAEAHNSSAQSGKTPLFKGSTSFQPFARDPAKQQRYEQYLELTKKGKKAELESIPLGSMTEWERNKEREEFARAAQLYRPLSTMMASRFTTAKFQDDDNTVEMPADEVTDKSDQKKAAEMKMFGKLTRERFEWHPDRVLCKRFNIASPYPESTLVGVPKVKRDKYSVFNFLNNPTESELGESQVNRNERDDKSAEESLPKKKGKERDVNFKPLAILASEDLSFQTATGTSRQQISDQALEPPKEIEDSKPDENEYNSSTERPTMDIFKAIFSDESDDESSSEDDDAEDKEAENSVAMEDEKRGKSATAMLASIFGKNTPSMDATDTPQKQDSAGTIHIESLEQRLSPQTVLQENTSSSQEQLQDNMSVHGPALPPNYNASQSDNLTETCTSDFRTGSFSQLDSSSGKIWKEAAVRGNKDVIMVSDGDEKDKKKHKSSKHKLKKKKSKHTKAKHKDTKKKREKKKKQKKDKKKRKKEVIEISSSSPNSSRSSDTSSDSETDAKLLQKLKTMSENKRASAADFM